MVNSHLVSSAHVQHIPVPPMQEAQLALAVADEAFLKALLTDCFPAIAHPHEIGAITVEVGVPLAHLADGSIDGILKFEQINCVLAGSYADAPPVPEFNNHDHYHAVTQCHSELSTLAHNLPLSDVVALLSRAGFDQEQIHQILHLPSQAWHKSWWYAVDLDGRLTIPFQRLMRTRRFADGTITVQFKDYYGHAPPSGFSSQLTRIPLLVHNPEWSFCENLSFINLARRELDSQQAILIAQGLSELEVEGYMRQNVSLFQKQVIQLPLEANCRSCHQIKCPLHGVDSSPVMACRSFLPTDPAHSPLSE
jgi:hypothetical protein